MKIAVVVGTRPEAIKLAPVITLLGAAAHVIHTGQHHSPGMTGHLTPHTTIPATTHPTRGHQLGHLITALADELDHHLPDAVLVQGDTTSALAGALAATTHQIPLAHLEAGLRSGDRTMPEEHNRILIDHLADLCFAPTLQAEHNLTIENIPAHRIHLTGNTIVEAALAALPDDVEQTRILEGFQVEPGRFVLATIHRPENVDDPGNLAAILRQLGEIPVPVLFPLHPRTAASIERFGLSRLAARLQVCGPLDYPVLLTLILHAAGLVTDSGGIQEEATILGRPLLVVRRSNERPEAERLVGARTVPAAGQIVATAASWLDDAPPPPTFWPPATTPFGDGSSSQRVVRLLTARFGTAPVPQPAAG